MFLSIIFKELTFFKKAEVSISQYCIKRKPKEVSVFFTYLPWTPFETAGARKLFLCTRYDPLTAESS